jgi:hypothetical protein
VQVRVELQYKGSLDVPMTMEVHAINDATYSKVAGWLPESEKMQAELEGNRINRQLNVRCRRYSQLHGCMLQMPRLGGVPRALADRAFLCAEVFEMCHG